MKQSPKKSLTLKTINKSNIWDVQENDIFRMWSLAEKDAEIKDNARHYTDIISSAFDIEILKIDKPEIRKKFAQETGGRKTPSRQRTHCAPSTSRKRHSWMSPPSLLIEERIIRRSPKRGIDAN